MVTEGWSREDHEEMRAEEAVERMREEEDEREALGLNGPDEPPFTREEWEAQQAQDDRDRLETAGAYDDEEPW